MNKWAMMAMIAMVGCQNFDGGTGLRDRTDLASRFVKEDVEVEQTGRLCNVEKTYSSSILEFKFGKRGLVFMGYCNFSSDESRHAVMRQVEAFGTSIGAVEARFYQLNMDRSGSKTIYDWKAEFYGKPKAGQDKSEECKEKYVELSTAVKMDYHPEQGAVFVHDGRRLKVVQTFAEGEEVNGVMVYPVFAVARDEDALVGAGFEVVSAYRYCNMEYLRPGLYRYAGTDSYTTKEDVINTVRVFAELPQEESKGE